VRTAGLAARHRERSVCGYRPGPGAPDEAGEQGPGDPAPVGRVHELAGLAGIGEETGLHRNGGCVHFDQHAMVKFGQSLPGGDAGTPGQLGLEDCGQSL